MLVYWKTPEQTGFVEKHHLHLVKLHNIRKIRISRSIRHLWPKRKGKSIGRSRSAAAQEENTRDTIFK
jgi:hypothetical protein